MFPVLNMIRCWDGVNLDSPDHRSHVAYPSGTFEGGGACPSSHPVKIPQLFYEVVWDTTPFNNKADWSADGSQPFVWSYGDSSGYGSHGDYMFGWKGDALQRAMDQNCNGFQCNGLRTQSIQQGNQCTKKSSVDEQIDGCEYSLLKSGLPHRLTWYSGLTELPGGLPVTGTA